MSLRRCLLVSYVFPPSGGAGVQRPTKFVKYLPQHGWKAYVLTARNPSVPTLDNSLASDIPEGTVIYRARTLEPSYAIKRSLAPSQDTARRPERAIQRAVRSLATSVFQPDPQVLWIPDALRIGVKAIKSDRLEAIVVSGPPFSTFILGALLSRITGKPLILDYRDEWTISTAYWENRKGADGSTRSERRMEAWVMQKAAAVIATTAASATTLRAAGEQAGSKAAVTHIYNGFDPTDFVTPASMPAKQRPFRLVYVGTLWTLTSIEPLVNAVRVLQARLPSVTDWIEVQIVGRVTPAQESCLADLSATGVKVVRCEYVSHTSAIDIMRTANALLVLLSGVPGAERVVPAKIFEYLASQRPILAVMPTGEAASLMRDIGGVVCLDPLDIEGIAEWISDAVKGALPASSADPKKLAAYRRDSQAGLLAEVIERASGSPGAL